jgi:hypothetical protein
MGYPSAPLGYGGQTIGQSAALFIGNGFRIAGTTLSKSLFYDGDFVRPQASTVTLCGFHVAAGDHFTTGSTTPVSLAMAGIPANTTVLELQAMISGTATTYPQILSVLNGIGGGPAIYATVPAATVASVQSAAVRIARPGSDTIQYTAYNNTAPSSATIDIRPAAYNMNIPRLGR